DPDDELAAPHAPCAGGLGLQVGAGLLVGRDHGFERREGAVRYGLADYRWVRGIAHVLCLRLSITLDERDQRSDQDRIVGCVVDPAVPEHSMLGRSDQRTASTGERLCPV